MAVETWQQVTLTIFFGCFKIQALSDLLPNLGAPLRTGQDGKPTSTGLVFPSEVFTGRLRVQYRLVWN